MVKRILSWAAVAGVVAAAVLLVNPLSSLAQKFPTSDQTAGYVVFPKVSVDTADLFHQARNVDTLIQLTNTSATACRAVHCFYIDATNHCSNGTNSFDPATGTCRTNRDCNLGGVCLGPAICGQGPDFTVFLSAGQAVGWPAATGTTVSAEPGCPVVSPQTILGTGTSYFTGEVKCVEVDAAYITSLTPINSNDLKGEASIYEAEPGPVGRIDVRAYNGVGFQTIATDGSDQNDRVMCLGATHGSAECPTAEYASCPNVLVLDHWFDGAIVNVNSGVVTASTDLTLVPCSEDVEDTATPRTTTTTAQFLVYNEFEQRFSTSTRVDCFLETQLSAIDAPMDPTASIFNVAVQGTLTGQTRIRPVLGSETDRGHGLIGVAEEFNSVPSLVALGSLVRGSAAFNLNYIGLNQTAGSEHGDFVRLP